MSAGIHERTQRSEYLVTLASTFDHPPMKNA